MDNSFDNLQVALEQKRLREYVEEKNNVALMNIVCFEYILLEFRKLIDWIYAPEDEFRIKRAGVIAAREKILDSIQSDDMDYKAIKEIIEYDKNSDNLLNVFSLGILLIVYFTTSSCIMLQSHIYSFFDIYVTTFALLCFFKQLNVCSIIIIVE